jgi:hypothetical protein
VLKHAKSAMFPNTRRQQHVSLVANSGTISSYAVPYDLASERHDLVMIKCVQISLNIAVSSANIYMTI